MTVLMIDLTTEGTASDNEATINQPNELLTQKLESDNTASIPKKVLCGVCTSRESHYKCSNCYLPYCTLACSNAHKATHPDQPLNSQQPKAATVPSNPLQVETPNTQCDPYTRDPFASLDESKDLQSLFKIYPNLPSVLEKIYEATLPPVNTAHTHAPNGRAGRGKNGPSWTSDIGLQKGVKALHAAKDMSNLDGEGVRAYMRLVMDIIHNDPEKTSAEQIRRELAEQDTQTIMRMLDGNI
ncbi:hypothetical protein K3495_g4862 [Podosphaera aphanis]|nr:hypothetical protein K3495_g4862 [Podosphaera aphanis]